MQPKTMRHICRVNPAKFWRRNKHKNISYMHSVREEDDTHHFLCHAHCNKSLNAWSLNTMNSTASGRSEQYDQL